MDIQRWVRIAIFAIYGICFFKRAGGPLIADEIDFVKPISQWVLAGPQREGLWHSPLYPWLLSLLGKSFGLLPTVARLIGFLSITFSAVFLCMTQRRLDASTPRWKTTVLWTLGLLSPIALGSSLILDYDTTLLVAASAFYFYSISALSDDDFSGAKFAGTTFSFAVCLMAKETTPLIYPMLLVLILLRKSSFLRALGISASVTVIGLLGFLIFGWLWCQVYTVPFKAIFEMDLLGLHIHGGTPAPWSKVDFIGSVWFKLIPFIWIGFPVAIWFCIYLIQSFLNFKNTEDSKRRTHQIFAFGIALVILVYSFFLRQRTYQFPKYMAPLLPWIYFLFVASLSEFSLSWCIGSVIWFLIIADPMAVLYQRDLNSFGLYLLSFAPPFLLWIIVKRARFSSVILATILGLSASYCKVALTSEKSITYWYGEQSIHEARSLAKVWREKHPNGMIVVPAKDLAWATQDYGSVYLYKEQLEDRREQLCKSPKPILLLTRVREDSSLLRSPQLEAYRRCLSTIVQGVDIVTGEKI